MKIEKKCIVCGCDLTLENTTAYRLKNYIYKCNDCMKIEKREWARLHPPESTHYGKYRVNLNKRNPVKYTCRNMRGDAKKRADRIGLDFNLTTEYLIGICPETCPVFKVPIKYGAGKKERYSASLDRINPNEGYVIGNVQVISNLANMMKNQASPDEMLLFAEWVYSTIEKSSGAQGNH